MKKLLLLLPCLFGMFLAGCATPLVYDPSTGGYYTQNVAFDPDTGQYVTENTPVDDSAGVDGPAYYTDDGVDYYSSGGRYFYYRDHQRFYLSHLPGGGHYNSSHAGYASRHNTINGHRRYVTGGSSRTVFTRQNRSSAQNIRGTQHLTRREGGSSASFQQRQVQQQHFTRQPQHVVLQRQSSQQGNSNNGKNNKGKQYQY